MFVVLFAGTENRYRLQKYMKWFNATSALHIKSKRSEKI